MARRSPGWMTESPSAQTRSTVADRSATVKYGREAVSPGPVQVMDPEAQVVGVGLPPRSHGGGPRRELDPEDSVPEPQGAIGVVGRELDERGEHASMATRFALAGSAARCPVPGRLGAVEHVFACRPPKQAVERLAFCLMSLAVPPAVISTLWRRRSSGDRRRVISASLGLVGGGRADGPPAPDHISPR
jgi:hypothetical protein